MKHPLNPTIMLILMFLVSQLVGLAIVNEYVDVKGSFEAGETVKNDEAYLRIGIEPPTVENESLTFIYILFAVIVGTIIILVIIKFKKGNLWKLWYFVAIFLSITLALNPLLMGILEKLGISQLHRVILVFIALALGFFKVFKPNIYVHNITEIFIYGGIAALMVPILDLFSATVLLVLISVYDAYAVWKSKHMIKMAKFQQTTNVFAGLSVPYELPKKAKTRKSSRKEKTVQTAILGGGDIAFPLLFSGVVMKITGSYLAPFVITVTTTIALTALLAKSEKGKFYPAMPFISLGCFAGFLLSFLF